MNETPPGTAWPCRAVAVARRLGGTLLLLPALASAAQFTPGSLVAYRVGNGAAAVGANANPVFLDEYGPDGTLLQSLALPTAAGTAPTTNPLTASSTGSEGLLTRTTDGACLAIPGYAAAVGTVNVGTTAATSVQRGVAFVNAAGNVDTTTKLGTSAFGGTSGNVRGAAGDTCSRAWVSGNGAGAANYGVWYVTKGATTSAQIYNVNSQGIAISNGALYVSASSGNLDTVGSGLPTSGIQAVTRVSPNIATSNYRGVTFLALQAGATSNDTMYLANNVSNTIDKYSFDGTNWNAKGGMTTAGISGVNTHGLTAINLGDGHVALYFTNSKGGIVYRAFDNSGATGTLATNTPYTVFATAAGQPTNAVFYGVAPAPVTALPTAVPNVPGNALATNVTTSGFTATWTAPVGGATTDFYVVEVSADNFATIAQTALVAGTQTTASFTGLSGSTNYYRIRAVNGAGASADLASGVNVPQTITWTSALPAVAVGGTGTLSGATSSAGLAVAYSSLTPTVCTVAGTSVTGVAIGTCTVAADQAGNNQYAAAAEVQRSFSVGGTAQTITFGAAPSGLVVAGTAAVAATSTSGLAIAYTSATPTVCSVSGSTVTGLGVGTCTIAADQPGNAQYAPASEVQQSFAVGKGNQSIAFGTTPALAVGTAGTIAATASSGLAVVLGTTTPGVCSLSGNTVAGLAAGNCVVTADQAGNANYNAAITATLNVTVGAGSQTVSFTAVPTVAVGRSDVLSAGASSGLPVAFSSMTTGVCTVAGNVVSGIAAGTCVVAGDQAGNANYNAAPTATLSVLVDVPISTFAPGALVISTVANVNLGGTNLDSAAPIVLRQLSFDATSTTASLSGMLPLPQTSGGNQSAISGEFGSASEGILQQSVNGLYLTVMGYGVNAVAFNTGGAGVYGAAALGQSTSLTAANQAGTPVATVPRVVALIGADGTVDTSTQLTGLYNQNNPRSVTTVDGTAFYTSGQGASKTDATQGVAYALLGATTATTIDNSTDTRVVSLIDAGGGETLYVSRDQKPPSGANNFTNIGTLTDANGNPPTSAAGVVASHVIPPASPLSSGGNNGSIDLTAGLANGVNNARIGSFVYLSPEQYFVASPTVIYVADSGQPKSGSANAAGLGAGGLQKWVLTNGAWTMAYDLVNGLNLVNNATANSNTPTAPGVTGLLALTGRVVGNQVQLFATSYGLNELSQSYLYTITDDLGATSISQVGSESFTVLFTDPTGQTSIRGIAFAPGIQQTIAFGAVPAFGAGGTGIIGATGGGSGSPVTFSSLTPAVCTVSGATVTGVAAGTCTVAANQAGNATYGPAAQATQSFAVGGAAQVIAFGASSGLTVGGTAALSASSSAGLPPVYASLTPTTCAVAGGQVTGLAIGTCTVAADQPGNAQYAAAPEVTQTLSVSGQAQTIAFGPLSSISVGATTNVSASASSGLPVSFASLTPSVCTVTGGAIAAIAVGTCTIAADQAGNATYAAAMEATQSFSVTAATAGGEVDADADVPLPGWAYLALGLGLAYVTHARRRRRI